MTKKLYLIIVPIVAILSIATWHGSIKYMKYRKAISSTTKDPDSTKFASEKITRQGIYCGQINSKNSYGAYIGLQRVISDGECYVIFEDGVVAAINIDGDNAKKANCSWVASMEKSKFELDKRINFLNLKKNRREKNDSESDDELQLSSSLSVFNDKYSSECK